MFETFSIKLKVVGREFSYAYNLQKGTDMNDWNYSIAHVCKFDKITLKNLSSMSVLEIHQGNQLL